jgi:hypothetical protein
MPPVPLPNPRHLRGWLLAIAAALSGEAALAQSEPEDRHPGPGPFAWVAVSTPARRPAPVAPPPRRPAPSYHPEATGTSSTQHDNSRSAAQEKERQQEAAAIRAYQLREVQRQAEVRHNAQAQEAALRAAAQSASRRQAELAANLRAADARHAADARRAAAPRQTASRTNSSPSSHAAPRQAATDRDKQQAYLQSLKRSIRLRAGRCPSSTGHFVFGERPQVTPQVVACVNVYYTATCPGQTRGWSGVVRKFPVGNSGACGSQTTTRLQGGSSSCQPNLAVKSVEACKR